MRDDGISMVMGMEVLLYVCDQEAKIGVRCQEGGPGVDRAMTSTVRAGSVTTHVLRNEVLQKHIDVRVSVDRGPLPFLDSTAMIPRMDGVQMPAVRRVSSHAY